MNEQTVSPMPQETPVKEVPMKGIPIKAVPLTSPVKSMPYTQAISAKNPPEVQVAIPIGERNMETFPSLSFLVSSTNQANRLNSILWKTFTCHCRGFARTVNFNSDDWKTCLENWTNMKTLKLNS